MKIWTNTQFKGFYSAGTAAVVIAPTAERACDLLNDALVRRGLPPGATVSQFERVFPLTEERAILLNDGNY